METQLSIIIPSYNCRHVAKTVENIYENSVTSPEVIVVLDSFIPEPPINTNHKNLVIIKNSENKGMRASINIGARIAAGDFLMKTDDHCIFSKEFDKNLIEHINANQIAIPSMYKIDINTWDKKRQAEEYFYAAYPYDTKSGIGLYAKKWQGSQGNNPLNIGPKQYLFREKQRSHIKIDEIMAFHGSCWFTTKEHFYNIGGLEEKEFSTLYFEPAELLLKTYLSGGNVIVNKHCWYAHMHKAKQEFGEDVNVRGYHLDLGEMRKTERFGTALFMNDRWAKANRKIDWFVDHFWPIPGWSGSWKEERDEFYKNNPIELKSSYLLEGI